MAYRKAMDELEELDEIKEGTNNDHNDETSTETPIVDVHRECALPFKAFSPTDGIIPEKKKLDIIILIIKTKALSIYYIYSLIKTKKMIMTISV